MRTGYPAWRELRGQKLLDIVVNRFHLFILRLEVLVMLFKMLAVVLKMCDLHLGILTIESLVIWQAPGMRVRTFVGAVRTLEYS